MQGTIQGRLGLKEAQVLIAYSKDSNRGVSLAMQGTIQVPLGLKEAKVLQSFGNAAFAILELS